ncbi:MAG TPA: hypothetical protein VF940_09075 [Streptosporangiaceae bacterium]
MRNAGDRVPGGSSSRRQRAADAEPLPPGGGASLFTPAYRVSQPATGSNTEGGHTAGSPARGAGDVGSAGTGFGRSPSDLPGSGHSWSGSGQPAAGYDQAAYASGSAGPGGPGGADGPVWPDDDLRSAYSWATDDEDSPWPDQGMPGRGTIAPNVLSNAVRGFPPAPGEPLPVYPPGPFAAWNRGQPDRQRGRDGQPAGSSASGHADTSQLAIATITPDEFDTDYSLPAIKDPIPGQPGRAAAGRAAADRDQRSASTPGGRARHGQPQREVVKREQVPAAPGGGRARAKSDQSGRTRKKRQPVWLAIGTAGVIVAAVAAVLVLTSLGRGGGPAAPPKPTNSPAPARTSPTPPPGKWGYIASRKTDAVPLTTGELYPGTISNAGTVYTRVKQTKSTNCRAALIGGALQAAVRHGHCTQTLRATYLSKSAKVMGTIGVFNLKNYAAANSAASKAGHSEFVAQLAAKAGPASAIGQGTGIEEALVKGHYLVLVWAEDTNLNPPKGKAGRARLTAFMHLLFSQTVSLSLTSRMVDGKPLQHA